jgi:LysR family transcriptional regulator, transcriptional activator for bauABCD operon
LQVAQSDLRSLAVFRAVVEHRSFLGAQVALGMSQSAVSFHIKALEDRLGFRICTRGRSGFELTDRGSVVYEKSKALFLSLNGFESDIGALRNRMTGTLRLGLVDNTITDDDLPIHRIISSISRKAPEALIKITIDVPEALVADLGNGGIDIALIPEVQPYRGLKFSPFKQEIHSLYCAIGHPLFGVPEPDLTRAEIEKHAFVVRPYANMRELQHFPGAAPKATASNMEAQAMFVRSGHYLGYLPDHYAKVWIERGLFRAMLPSQTTFASTFFVATRAGDRPSSVLDLFVRELVAMSSERLHLS